MDLVKLMSKAGESLSVGRVFGAPIERDGVLLIPVAWVAGGGGGGGQEPNQDEPGGSGGGFGGVSWPLGMYVVEEGTVRWVPVIDATRIVLGVLARTDPGPDEGKASPLSKRPDGSKGQDLCQSFHTGS